MFTVNRLTENFRLTGFLINRTETGNMATALSAKIFFNFCAVKSKYTIYRSSLIWVYWKLETFIENWNQKNRERDDEETDDIAH